MYKPYHLIGLELGISVLSAALRGERQAQAWCGDVVAVAKRALRPDEMLDGEGGYTVWGRLMPAARSVAENALPSGLAHRVRLMRDIPAGEIGRWADVVMSDSEAVTARQERKGVSPWSEGGCGALPDMRSWWRMARQAPDEAISGSGAEWLLCTAPVLNNLRSSADRFQIARCLTSWLKLPRRDRQGRGSQTFRR
jgi:hypothetical protein